MGDGLNKDWTSVHRRWSGRLDATMKLLVAFFIVGVLITVQVHRWLSSKWSESVRHWIARDVLKSCSLLRCSPKSQLFAAIPVNCRVPDHSPRGSSKFIFDAVGETCSPRAFYQVDLQNLSNKSQRFLTRCRIASWCTLNEDVGIFLRCNFQSYHVWLADFLELDWSDLLLE